MRKTIDAIGFLRQRAEAAGVGARLRPVRELAVEAGVSHYTLSKALRELCREGVLGAKPRAGIVVKRSGVGPGTVSVRDEDSLRTRARWEQIALVLSRRIRSLGSNPPVGQVLPKEVCVEFGVSYQTARKAIDSLVEQDILVPYSRGYVAVGSQSYGNMGVLCTTRTAREYSTVDEGRVTRVFANQFERVCALERVPLEYAFLGYDEHGVTGAQQAVARLRELARHRPRVMALVQAPGLSPADVAQVCAMSQSVKVPVVVVDFGNQTSPADLPRYRLGFMGIDRTHHAGRVMGDFLVGKRYRRVGVIGWGEGGGWQRARHEAIVSRVHQRTSEVQFFSYQVPEPAAEGVGVEAFTPALLKRESRRYQRLVGQMRTDAELALAHYRLRSAVHPLLSTALHRDSPDVLVGLNDSVAVAVLDVLYSMGIDVPEECAVAGFDDTSLAFAAHLSSYNYNWHAVAREILRFGYTCPASLRRPSLLEVDGFVVERMTTAAPPRQGRLPRSV